MTTPADPTHPPIAPPAELRDRYLKLSWAYVRWCIGMLIWAAACIFYFVITRQYVELGIAIFLGVILIAMVFGPAFLFGGETWYKRLGWMVVLLCMFSMMWVYPFIAVGVGIRSRLVDGRYSSLDKVFWGDWVHLGLSLLTVLIALWTFILTWRVVKMTRQLARGEYGVTNIKAGEPTK